MKTQKKLPTVIFDLDDTVINSRHRQPNNPDGTLNLQAYILLHTPENVAKDTLLPLASVMQRMIASREYIVIVLTARHMHKCDYEFLERNGLMPNIVLSREQVTESHYKMGDGDYKTRWFKIMQGYFPKDRAVIMFDDAAPVKKAMRALGIPTLCGHKVNRRLGA